MTKIIPLFSNSSQAKAIQDVNALNGATAFQSFISTAYNTVLAGSGTASLQTGGGTGNPNRTNTGINITTTTSINDCSMVLIPFTGPKFGLCWRGSATTGLHVTVDETNAVFVNGQQPYLVVEGQTIGSEVMTLVTHNNLSFGQHVARVHVPCGILGSLQLLLFGYIVDANYQNQIWTPMTQPSNAGALTNAAVQIPTSSEAGYVVVHYVNTDSVAHQVAIKFGATQIAELVLQPLGTAGSYQTFLISGGMLSTPSGTSNMTHQADVGAKVNYCVVGGQ